mgnify:CR=1 FL=1
MNTDNSARKRFDANGRTLATLRKKHKPRIVAQPISHRHPNQPQHGNVTTPSGTRRAPRARRSDKRIVAARNRDTLPVFSALHGILSLRRPQGESSAHLTVHTRCLHLAGPRRPPQPPSDRFPQSRFSAGRNPNRGSEQRYATNPSLVWQLPCQLALMARKRLTTSTIKEFGQIEPPARVGT